MGDLESRVHEMAASFVKYRTKEFLTTFLVDSGVAHDLYQAYIEQVLGERILTPDEFTAKLVTDYAPMFGQMMGLSYALGYADHLQGKTYQELYVPLSLVKNEEETSQLVLPGVLD